MVCNGFAILGALSMQLETPLATPGTNPPRYQPPRSRPPNPPQRQKIAPNKNGQPNTNSKWMCAVTMRFPNTFVPVLENCGRRYTKPKMVCSGFGGFFCGLAWFWWFSHRTQNHYKPFKTILNHKKNHQNHYKPHKTTTNHDTQNQKWFVVVLNGL